MNPAPVSSRAAQPTTAAVDNGPNPIRQVLPWLVAVALFMESLDTTILNTAVPKIADAFGVLPLQMKGALSSYTLSLAVFIPISGWMADRFGTRRVFFSAMGIFTLGSLLCGFSTGIVTLVASRIIQGAGGAMMVPVGRICLVRTFPKKHLLKVISFVAIPGLIGPLLGPLAGGLLVSYVHWRAIFFVNLPIGIAGIVLAITHMPDYRSARRLPLDFVGLVLFGSGVALLSYVLEVFGENAVSPRAMIFLIGLALLMLAGYGLHAPRQTFPLLRLSLFKQRTFRAAIAGGLLARLGTGGMPFLLPLLFQVGMGYSPVQSGLLIMPQSLAAIGLRLLATRILKAFGFKRVLLTNTCLIGALIALFATMNSSTPVWLIVAEGLLFGFSSSLHYTSMNTLVFADLSEADTSMGATIGSTIMQLSLSFGVAVSSLLAEVFIGSDHSAGNPRFVPGIHAAFLTLGAFTVLSSAIFLELKTKDGAALSLNSAGD